MGKVVELNTEQQPETKAILLVIEDGKVGGATVKGSGYWTEILLECTEIMATTGRGFDLSLQLEPPRFVPDVPPEGSRRRTWRD